MAKNTVSAYRRDLFRYALFLHAQGVTEPGPGDVATPDELRPGRA